MVVHCERDENIRIISARLATIYESKQYKENL
nr:BrnT family toxin [Haemophilus haemolyticus]